MINFGGLPFELITFIFIESHKIQKRVTLSQGKDFVREWKHLEEIVVFNKRISEEEREVSIAHLGNILGRTFDEVMAIHKVFQTVENTDRFFQQTSKFFRAVGSTG